MQWGPMGSIIFRNWNFFNYAVAKDFQYWKCTRPKFPGCAIWKCVVRFFLNAAWGVTVGIQWGPKGSIIFKKQGIFFFCSCYAVANYILEANIEARSGWPLPKPALSDSFLEFMSIPRRPSTTAKIVLWYRNAHCAGDIDAILNLFAALSYPTLQIFHD